MTRLPAEWEAQSAILLTWPNPDGDFAASPDAFDRVCRCFEQLTLSIARYQPVRISVGSDSEHTRLKSWLAAQSLAHAVTLYRLPSNDVWARDHSPIGVYRDGQTQLLKFGFDGWGGKYPADKDNALAPQLAAQGAFGNTPLVPVDLVLEGGAIDSDGQGTLLATRSSVLDPRRNPARSVQDIEQCLLEAFGLQRILWLDHGALQGDDTDGHIDTLARFVSADSIVYQAAGDADDVNREELERMADELRALRTLDGRPYRLIALPWAGVHRNEDGDDLPASYANFLILNGAVLMPTYGSPADAVALDALRGALPEHDIVGVDCQALIRQYGSLHCVTMNLPA